MRTIAAVLAAAGFCALIFCLGYQGWLFLQYGYWPGIDATYLLSTVFPEVETALRQNWLGVIKILQLFNAGFFVFVLALIPSMFVFANE